MGAEIRRGGNKMADFTLPFQQTATKLNGDGIAFEVDCQATLGAVAIAGKVPNVVLATGVYGEVGGPFPQNLIPIKIKEKATTNLPAAGAAGLVGPGFLTGAVVGQTNMQSETGVCGASQYGNGIQGLSDSGMGVYGESGSGAGVQASSKGGVGVLATSQTQDAINGTSSAQGHAGVSANNNNGGYGLWARSWGTNPGTGGIAGYFNSDGNNAINAVSTSENYDAIVAQSSSSAHAAVSATNTAQNNNGAFGVWANSPNGIAIYGQGKTAGHFQGDITVTGTLTVGVDIVMPASDFAEDFSVEASAVAEPGTVMVLDENGLLRPCGESYDRKVVGVVSGAGNYRPGLILDRQKSTEGRLPLALVGKVYCKVDATYGSVEVGDLLTSSATPGHGMRASDPQQAFGAVIGKALAPLKSGQALVAILVSLQ